MYEVPASSDAVGRRALRRLQEVGVHVLAPAEALAADPLPDAVAVMQLAVAASAHRAGGVKVGATGGAGGAGGAQGSAASPAARRLTPAVPTPPSPLPCSCPRARAG